MILEYVDTGGVARYKMGGGEEIELLRGFMDFTLFSHFLKIKSTIELVVSTLFGGALISNNILALFS